MHFYWHNTREKQDNCKVLFRIKIEGLFLILNKTEQLSCFTRVLPIKIQKSILLLLKFFLIPFAEKGGTDNQSARCIREKKNYLSI